jgi:6-phosphogluconolactonase
MLLGLGEDAHIASIFPDSELLKRRSVKGRPTADEDAGRGVAAVWASHLNAWRITLTPDAILDSRDIVVVVAGGAKAGAVRAALERPLDETRYPAQLLRQAGGRVQWIVDRAAAAALESRDNHAG